MVHSFRQSYGNGVSEGRWQRHEHAHRDQTVVPVLDLGPDHTGGEVVGFGSMPLHIVLLVQLVDVCDPDLVT